MINTNSMDNSKEEKTLEQIVEERLTQLPQVVQNAIRSGDVTAHMRKLAETHKLHVDQWETLEEEVQYTLLGLQPAEELEQNIKNEVGVTAEVARALTLSIAETVFEPIREALERELSHPEAKKEEVGALETSRQQAIASEHATAVPNTPRAVLPATPPPAPPQGTAKRTPISDTYLSSTPSHERKVIEGDPYREQTA
jgi:hypothetical protein